MKRALLLLAATMLATPALGQTIAITGGTVAIGDGSQPIEGGTVVIANGRIVAANTVIPLQHLMLHRDRLRREWASPAA